MFKIWIWDYIESGWIYVEGGKLKEVCLRHSLTLFSLSCSAPLLRLISLLCALLLREGRQEMIRKLVCGACFSCHFDLKLTKELRRNGVAKTSDQIVI